MLLLDVLAEAASEIKLCGVIAEVRSYRYSQGLYFVISVYEELN